MSPRTPPVAVHVPPELVKRLYRQAQAGRWDVAEASFAAALERSAAKAFADGAPDPSKLERYLTSLHLDDLALACACAEGHAAAWDHFVLEYRPVLYRAADAIAPGGGARDLADSIYADLFGIDTRNGLRRSLFGYFHARSTLGTWLRAVLSQRHVDRIRAERKLTSIDEEGSVEIAATPRATVDPDTRRYLALIRIVLAAVIAALPDRDRLRLGCYYRQDLTLAQTGRLLGEHEATASRQLARTRKVIRAEVERRLRDEHRLAAAEIARCLECTVDDPGRLDLAELLGTAPARKDSAAERSI